MLSTFSSLLLAFCVVGLVIVQRYLAQHDTREPPVAPGGMPFIGHALRLYREGFEFSTNMSKETGLPIFTVQLPGQKMYFVANIDLIQKIEKIKALSWQHISVKFTSLTCGLSSEAQQICFDDPLLEGSVQNASSHAFTAGVRPGENLDIITRTMAKEVCALLDDQVLHSGSIKLLAWVRKTFTTVSTNSVYGEKNPYRDESVSDAYWKFDKNMLSLIMLPTWMTPGTIKARDKLASAFVSYFKGGCPDDASPLMKIRYAAERQHGLPVEDIARIEAGVAIAILDNTIIASFWMILLIFADPKLLSQIRAEIDSVTTVQTIADQEGNTKTIRNIEIPALQTECALLASTLEEVLRWRNVAASVREVTTDIILDNRWLLKKGSMIQMPSRIIHPAPKIWGDDVLEFRPDRFMKQKQPVAKPVVAGKYFRSFGGGTSLCPGRHWARHEILAFTTLFVARFDITPSNGKPWKLPTVWNTRISSVIMEPDTDVNINIKLRKGFEESGWTLSHN